MLRGLFPRLFSQFREGGLIVGQFLVSNSGATLTPTANCYQGLTAVGGDGTCVVTLAGGGRQVVVVGAHASMPDADDQTGARYLSVNQEVGINAGAGTVPLAVMKMDGTEDQEPLVDGSVVTVTLLVNK
jgi:hypothetical protein